MATKKANDRVAAQTKVIRKTAKRTKTSAKSTTWQNWKVRYEAFLERRPHRSFQLTSRRALPIIEPLPGYVSFTRQVLHTIRRFRKPFLYFALLYIAANLLVIGFVQQENYSFMRETVQLVGNEVAGGDYGALTKAFTLFGISLSGALSGTLSEVQQFSLGFAATIVALSIVWFLRHQLQGEKVSVRDALYNSGAPIVPAVILTLVGLIQLLPAGLGVLIYGVAMNTDISGAALMMFGVASGLLVLISLYWLISTIFAGIIITIPGTYPLKALRLAGDIVIGRRISLLFRFIWLLFMVFMLWLVIFLPTIYFASFITVPWLPIVPVILQLLTSFTLLFSTTYMYLLYRRVLDERRDQ